MKSWPKAFGQQVWQLCRFPSLSVSKTEGLLSSDRAKPGCFARIFHTEDEAVPTVNGLPLVSRGLEGRSVEPGIKMSSLNRSDKCAQYLMV
jgi:hypothetical protein